MSPRESNHNVYEENPNNNQEREGLYKKSKGGDEDHNDDDHYNNINDDHQEMKKRSIIKKVKAKLKKKIIQGHNIISSPRVKQSKKTAPWSRLKSEENHEEK